MIVFCWRTTLFSFPCGLWKTFPPISALIKGHIPSSLVGILAIHTFNEVAPSPWINIDGNISCASYFKAKISLLWVSDDAIKWHSQLFIGESYWSPKCMYQKHWVKYRGDQSEWLLRRWTTAHISLAMSLHSSNSPQSWVSDLWVSLGESFWKFQIMKVMLSSSSVCFCCTEPLGMQKIN